MDGGREDLRRLAVWLARRREVDEAVEQLTHYGPASSDRVHSHLDALRLLLQLEQQAFSVLEQEAPEVPQLPLRGALVQDETVVSLTSERSRRHRQHQPT